MKIRQEKICELLFSSLRMKYSILNRVLFKLSSTRCLHYGDCMTSLADRAEDAHSLDRMAAANRVIKIMRENSASDLVS